MGVYVEKKGSVSCVIPHCRLTVDQREVLEVVERGQNVFITGQAGTGKSFLVKEIFRSLSRKGTKCEVICSSGICRNSLWRYDRDSVHSPFFLWFANRGFAVIYKQETDGACIAYGMVFQ